MSHRHHSARANPASGPASYPSPDERLRLVARRNELAKTLIKLFVQGKAPDESRLSKLADEYGAKEVLHVTDVLMRQFQKNDFLIDEPRIYRHYRLGFARFGGTRRFLSKSEQDELNYERALLLGRREFRSALHLKPSSREQKLGDLLQMDWPFWEDITPPNIPPRPPEYPAPGSYPDPLSVMLLSGVGISIWPASRTDAPPGKPPSLPWSKSSSMKPCWRVGPVSLPVGRPGMPCICWARCTPTPALAGWWSCTTAPTTG